MRTTPEIAILRDKLVLVAKSSHPSIAYSEVDDLVGLDVRYPKDRKSLGELLSTIGNMEFRQQRPYLPVVVVRKDTKRPGVRFYKEVIRHYPNYEEYADDEKGIYRMVLARVIEYWSESTLTS